MKFRIGIDARSLASNRNGIGRYTFELISQLSIFDVELYLYSYKPLNQNLFNASNIFYRTPFFNFIPKFGTFWSIFLLAFSANSDKLDIFWSPAHRLPFFLRSNIPTIVTIHDLTWKFFPKTMRYLNYISDKFLMPQALMTADKVISVSINTSNDLIALYPALESKISTIYSGVPNIITRNIFNDSPQIKSTFILFVGTFEPRKNLDRLINAFSLIPSVNRKNLSLVIAGSYGWGSVDPYILAKKYCVEDSVLIVINPSDSHLEYLYKNALFLVMPSLYEGFGFPVIESLAFGCVSMTSINSPMQEIAGPSGFYVDPFDVGNISQGINFLLTNPDALVSLKKHAKSRVEKFDWAVTALQTLKVFKQAKSIKYGEK